MMILKRSRSRAVQLGVAFSLPDFLVPALASARLPRSFSSTPRCGSRIGEAPISIPPEVDLRILEPAKRKNGLVATEPRKTVEIQGPLGLYSLVRGHCFTEHVTGKMTVQLPPYMTLSHNKGTKKASLSVLDREERKQREMWGMPASSPYARCSYRF